MDEKRHKAMIHEEICTYEVCKLAKEKGFDVDCEAFYYNDGFLQYAKFENWNGRYLNKFSAPTQSLLQRWLREEKELHIDIVATANGYIWLLDKTNGTSIADSDHHGTMANEDSGCYDTYELSLEDALKYALKNLL